MLTSKKSDFIDTKDIPLERYSEKLEEWQAYQNETLQNLLKDFVNHAKVNIQAYYLDKSTLQADNFQITKNIRQYRDKIIFIVDAFSLSLTENQNWAKQELDQNNKYALGGLLFPICEHLEEKIKFAKDWAKQYFPFIHQEWENELKYSFGHTELEVPNKTHFFRRLINIAFYKNF